jgi:uncharacterized Tic20 family protein
MDEQQQQVGSPFLTGSPAPTQDDKTMALMAHIGGIAFPIIVPAIIMATKGEKSPWVKAQSMEALNFQITVFIAYLVSFVLSFVCIGVFTFFAAGIAAVVLGIMAGLKANNGESYRYPATLRLIK